MKAAQWTPPPGTPTRPSGIQPAQKRFALNSSWSSKPGQRVRSPAPHPIPEKATTDYISTVECLQMFQSLAGCGRGQLLQNAAARLRAAMEEELETSEDQISVARDSLLGREKGPTTLRNGAEDQRIFDGAEGLLAVAAKVLPLPDENAGRAYAGDRDNGSAKEEVDPYDWEHVAAALEGQWQSTHLPELEKIATRPDAEADGEVTRRRNYAMLESDAIQVGGSPYSSLSTAIKASGDEANLVDGSAPALKPRVGGKRPRWAPKSPGPNRMDQPTPYIDRASKLSHVKSLIQLHSKIRPGAAGAIVQFKSFVDDSESMHSGQFADEEAFSLFADPSDPDVVEDDLILRKSELGVGNFLDSSSHSSEVESLPSASLSPAGSPGAGELDIDELLIQ